MRYKALSVVALVAVAGIASLPMTTPAQAGQVTWHIRPHGKDARILRTGLALFSAVQSFKNRARVDQSGNNNSAGIAQNGSGNGALLVQHGNGQTGTISQTGNGNGCALIQFGKNTNGSCDQNGNGQLDFVLQGGW
jgi:Curlin associated repeat